MTTPAKSAPYARVHDSRSRGDAVDEFLNARSGVGLCTVLVAVALLSIQDFWLPDGGANALHLLRLGELSLIAIAAGVQLSRPRRRVTIVVGIFFIGSICLTSAISGYLRHDPQTQVLTDLALAFGTSATLPWGLWPQLISVVVAALSATLGWVLVYGTLAGINIHLVTGVAIAFLASIYIAYQLERYRAERDDSEQALRAKEERFRSLIENASDTMTVLDAQGLITYESPSVERVLGPEEHIGRFVFDYVHPDDVARMPSLDGRPGDVLDFECRVRRKDGAWCHVQGVWTNLLNHPAVCGVVLNWRDVDDRRRAEEERTIYMRELADARDQALAATQAKSAFLANTSHEIRTPMNVIIGMTDMALETELETTARDYLQRVRAAALALLDIINDILDLSKIEAGKLDVAIGPVDLRATSNEVVRLLASSAAAKSLGLECRVDPSLPAEVHGDDGRVRQVLTNLVGNAIKFTEHGAVVLDVRVLRETPAYTVVLFTVRDTGIGIPRDRQQAVFQSFTQVDSGTTRTYGGTGLGLTISRQLVELMGGELHVESTVGEGSTFWFTLVAASSPGHSSAARSARRGDARNQAVPSVTPLAR
jgi:PAS domain S-box-containing protein